MTPSETETLKMFDERFAWVRTIEGRHYLFDNETERAVDGDAMKDFWLPQIRLAREEGRKAGEIAHLTRSGDERYELGYEAGVDEGWSASKILWDRMDEWQKEWQAEKPKQRALTHEDALKLIEWKIEKSRSDERKQAYEEGQKDMEEEVKKWSVSTLDYAEKSSRRSRAKTIEVAFLEGFRFARNSLQKQKGAFLAARKA